MLGPRLYGNTINLEPTRPQDVALRQHWLADIEITRLYGPPGVPSLAQEEEWYERTARDDSILLWSIMLNGTCIGTAQLHHIDWLHRQTRGATLIGDRTQWGKGYGSEVVRLRTAFALGEVGLERIETSSMVANAGMHRALERSGFRRIGMRSRCSYFAGTWHDEYIFELLRDEWLERQR